MSLELVAAVLRLTGLPAGRKLILVELADGAGRDGFVRITGTELATRTGLSKATIWSTVKELGAAGVLTIRADRGKEPNVYRINSEKLWELAQMAQPPKHDETELPAVDPEPVAAALAVEAPTADAPVVVADEPEPPAETPAGALPFVPAGKPVPIKVLPPSAVPEVTMGSPEVEEQRLFIPATLAQIPGFGPLWAQWMRYRRTIPKVPKEWSTMFQTQLTWLAEQPEVAMQALREAMTTGQYQLIRPKTPNAETK